MKLCLSVNKNRIHEFKGHRHQQLHLYNRLQCLLIWIPLWVRGSRIGPTCPPACRKRRLIGGDTNLDWILQNKFLFCLFFVQLYILHFLRILFMVCIYFIVFGYLFLYSLLLYDLVRFL